MALLAPPAAWPLVVMLVLGFSTRGWSLNPDDPNVCSHWER